MKTHNVGKKYSPVILLKFLLILASLFTACSTYAATLNVTAPSSSYSVGGSFTVTIVASSPEQALNAVDGTMSFPQDKLEVTSLSKEGSILSLWTEEPSYSNGAGNVNFSGVALNPGYTGSNGKVLKVNFKVKRGGNAAIVFSSGSILANDGQGTNILTSLNSKQFTLGEAVPVKSTDPVVTTKPGVTNPPKKGPVDIATTPAVVTLVEPIVISPEKSSGSIIPSEILHLIKTIFIYASILALLLFILGIVYFIVLYLWHRIVLVRIKMKSETREVSTSLYQALRLKVDKDFSAGDYLSALSGYRKLQEQAPSASQPELADRINITTKFFAAKDNLKRAQAAASREKWLEARILLEENEYMNDPLFVYRNDAHLLSEKVKARLVEIGEEGNSSRIAEEKKVVEKDHLIEETKSELVYQQSLLAAERAKREQAEEEYKKISIILKEKEALFESHLRNAESKLKAQESSFEQSLSGSKSSVEDRERKLEQTVRSVEEAKIAYLSEHALLVAEQAKNAALIEESNRTSSIAHDRETELEKQLAEAKVEVSTTVHKVVKVEATVAELKERLLEEHNQFLDERAKVDRIKEDAKTLNSLFQEKSTELDSEAREAKTRAREAENKLMEAVHTSEETKWKLDQELKQKEVERVKLAQIEETARKSESMFKEKESVLSKSLESTQKSFEVAKVDISTLSKKLSDAEATLEATKNELSKEKEFLVAEKARAESLMNAVSKFITPIAAETKAKLTKEQEVLAEERARADSVLDEILKFSKPTA